MARDVSKLSRLGMKRALDGRLSPAVVDAIVALMDIIDWWSKLDSDARARLITHNGGGLSPLMG